MSRSATESLEAESINMHNRIDGVVERIKLLEEKMDDHDVGIDDLKNTVGKISSRCLEIENAVKKNTEANERLLKFLEGKEFKDNNVKDQRPISIGSSVLEKDQKFKSNPTDIPGKKLILKSQAEKAQDELDFDKNSIYDTLRNPFTRTKQELCQYTLEAIEHYASGNFEDISQMFIDDFIFWTHDHFKLLSKASITKLRDILILKGVKIRKKALLPLSQAISEYVEKARDKYFEESNNSHYRTPGSQNRFNSEYSNEKKTSKSGRASEVGKLFSKENRYSGAPREPLRRLFRAFIDACTLAQIDTDDDELMKRIMQSIFLTGPALRYFQDVVKDIAIGPDESIDLLEAHFLGDRAKRVNDEVWHELSFHYIKRRREQDGKTSSFESILDDLIIEIADLADIRTGPGSDAVIMAKTLQAVRDVKAFAMVYKHPPKEIQDLNASLRSCALEADRERIRHAENASSYNTTTEYPNKKDCEVYYVDRVVERRNGHGKKNHFKGYGKASKEQFRYQRLPPDVCLVCHKRGCHSSRHKQKSRAFIAMENAFLDNSDSSSDNDSENSNVQANEPEQNMDFSYFSISSTIHNSRAIALMGTNPSDVKSLVDGAVIDTGSTTKSSIGENLVSAATATSSRPTNMKHIESRSTISGIGGAKVRMIGILPFWFNFGGRSYFVNLFVIPGTSPILLSHKDIDRIGLNYQSLYKVVERPDDGYAEEVEMRNYLPFLKFEVYSYLSSKELLKMHRNLGHPSVERQMKVIELAELHSVPKQTRKKIQELVNSCKACQLGRSKPRRFLFSVKDDITGDFNSSLQIDCVYIDGGYVLHIVCCGTGFQQGIF